jgi:hypothetical protein
MAKSEDKELIEEFVRRVAAVRNLVHHTLTCEDRYGFYLFGPPGCGKTTGIELVLEELGINPLLFRGTMSSDALYETVRASPDAIIWINDNSQLFKDQDCRQYLLGMLEPAVVDFKTGQSARMVNKTRTRGGGSDSFEFVGKLLFDTNHPLSAANPSLRAVKDRLVVHQYGPPDSEMAAVMRHLAGLSPGKSEYPELKIKKKEVPYWKKTTKKERLVIAEFIIEQAAKFKVHLSLRMLRDTVIYFVGQKEHGYTTDWRDVVIKDIANYDVAYEHSKPNARKERLSEELEHLKRILVSCADDDPTKKDIEFIWMEQTGQNDRQFRRRLAELNEEYRRIYDALSDGRNK